MRSSRIAMCAMCTMALVVAACTGDDASAPAAEDTTTPITATTSTITATASATTTSTTAASTAPEVEPASDLPWWNDRVFYEVFVRSFKDSDGDGIGDLAGLTASLDYLNDGDPATTDDLGVTGIWLMPISPSPSYHGYDVTDYREINPDYGTMDDFTAFLAAAHERGIAVLIDLVINHSSREHPWFEAALAGDPDDADWYLWADEDPGTPSPWHGGPMWHPAGDRFYFGLFWEGMPDLNLANPEVTAELRDVARFWLDDVGVDGFRLDAARHLIEDGATVSDTPATVAWLEGFNDYVDSIAPDALVLGEVWSPTAEVAAYVPDALDLAFEFELTELGGAAFGAQDARVFEDAMATVEASYPELQWATFLTNHDMNRIMSEVGGDVRLAKNAAAWLLTSPGVPFVYYGEEVGLQGVKPDERIRTPMPWNADAPGLGFTTGTPWEPPFEGYEVFNVADQTDVDDSLLSHYRSLIQFRAASAALRRGETVPVDVDLDTVMAYLRTDGDEHVLVLLNLAPDHAVGPVLDLPSGPLAGVAGVVPVVGPPAHAPQINAAGGFAAYEPLESIPPYGFLVLELTSDPSPPPPDTTTTTTTIVAATAADVAVVERLYELTGSFDTAALADLFAPDAVLYDGGGTFRLSDPLPPEAGFDQSWDWDGDGVVTVGDVVGVQIGWGAALTSEVEASCAPDGATVVCEVRSEDPFGSAAGIEPQPVRERYRVEGGVIVELLGQEGEPTPAAQEQAWLEQFAVFEQWAADTHPDDFGVAFAGPCCVGTPEALSPAPEAIEVVARLVTDWAATLGEN
ncbi:MAG: alpha-amylase family glycosyl hydrolase [Ilumatobacter sp.]|uniref:alpha-amylase family glycosyl hydrolase n=1 Tax=Ilumatobacter sp. TaxID=1967498 RepID=UPI0026086EC6|nr:alpha-amylase family glycosyl hydrolase [Ilumatobacter sp.]MDJ0769398.1 alpha-amylase family glycosyl hydrolase [Ilumatobacter sp.]